MMKQRIFYTLLTGLSLMCGCSSMRTAEQDTAQFYLDRGATHMKRKDYIKAIADFQRVVGSFPTSDIVDEAQYMLAEAHFKNEDYITAAYEFERVYEDYRSSKRAPEARLKRALCYYNESPKAELDQENTRLAIDDFNRFIDLYPDHDLVKEAQTHIDDLRAKLAYKDFKAGELYRKMKKYDSALIYYRLIIRDYPRTVWANESRFGIGMVYLKQRNFEKAKEMFQILANTAPTNRLKNKAIKKLDYIEKRLQRHQSK